MLSFLLAAALLSLSILTNAQGCGSYQCDLVYSYDLYDDCGVDPNDGSDFAYPVIFCPCSNAETLALSVTFTGTDGAGASN